MAAAGLFVLVGQQAFINVAVNLNMIPTKGMTLPFITLRRLVDAGHGPDPGHGPGADAPASGGLCQGEGLAKAGAFA